MSDRKLTNWSNGVYLTAPDIHVLECGRCRNMVFREGTGLPCCRVHDTHVVAARGIEDLCGDAGKDFVGWPWARVPFWRTLRFLWRVRDIIYRR